MSKAQHLTPERVFENAKISLINTRQARYKNVKFDSRVVGNVLILKTKDKELQLTLTDEIILSILFKFKYSPIWLTKQWLEAKDTLGSDEQALARIRAYIDFGLVYQYPTAITTFLMPTNALATLFGQALGRFKDPSYNVMTHEISEQDVMFNVMMGRTNYTEGIKTFPYVSHFFKQQTGSMIIPEKDYAISNNSVKTRAKEIENTQATLIKEIKEGKTITTPDMKQKDLTIFKKQANGSFNMKVPDLAILAPRTVVSGVARPNSVAIEVELTEKDQRDYDKIFDTYANNLIYGKIVYLITSERIKEKLQNSYNRVYKKQNKSCNIEIMEYEIPYNHQELYFC